MTLISTQNISKSFGRYQALAPLTEIFPEGKTTVLVGPSGCGKSTLLKILLRLVEPDSGSVLFDSEEITPENVESIRRQIGYVIQDGGLFPHLTARQNVALLAKFIGWKAADIDVRISELSELVQIPPHLLHNYPSALSGGQRQRISLMRALMLNPKVLLLDEPLGALDPITRYELQESLRQIFADLKKTVVLVTHDMGEAAHFGDNIVLMRSGAIVQQGTFEDLLKWPAEAYVSEFIRAQRSPLPSLAAEL